MTHTIHHDPLRIEDVAELAAHGDSVAIHAAQAYRRMQEAPLGSTERRFHRRAWVRLARKALEREGLDV